MAFEKCTNCGEFDFTERHRCAPKWHYRVIDQWGDDDWEEVHARSNHDAAKKAAEAYDVGEYNLLGGSEIVVAVRSDLDDPATEKRFKCYGEAEPVYYANEVKSND